MTIAAALNGLLKELFADELLATANGALQTVREGLRLGGPLAARRHRPPEFIGVLASAQGAGSVVGGLVVARLIGRGGAATATGLAAFGLGDGLCVLPWLPGVLAGKAVAGAGLAVMIVGFTTALQRRTPRPLVGRVSLAAEALTSGPQTASIAAGALLVSAVDYRLLFLAVTTGMFGAAAYLWHGRALTLPVPVPEAVAG